MVVNLKNFINMKVKTKLNKNDTKTNQEALTAEEKRLQSIAVKKQQYKSHKNAIKFALANLDVKTNNKVVFNEDSENELENKKVPLKNGHSSKKQSLFEDNEDESEEEYNFEVKEQFQGKKGKKLLELQSKYKNDKRFALDERFLEDNESNSDNEDINEEKNNEVIENDLVKEKQKDLAVLEEILGTKINKKPEKVKKLNKKTMIRYDPSNPEFANLEVQNTEVKPPKKRKRKEVDEDIEGKKEEEVKEVPGTFYEVKENLKESLQENQPFSLLNMFGRSVEEEEKMEEEIKNDSQEVIEKKSVVRDKNPFRYDSSDNESEIEDNGEGGGEKEQEENDGKFEEVESVETRQRKINLGPRKLWTDPFFFKKDDYRFQEGFDFVKRFEIEDTEFSTVRRNIKEIVIAKVKHSQKKNKMFKKKLGGKKMIKMKKALKR